MTGRYDCHRITQVTAWSKGCHRPPTTAKKKEKTMSCQGMTREGKGSTHGQEVYSCKHCGAGGCESDDSTNQNFGGDKRLKCGSSLSRERGS